MAELLHFPAPPATDAAPSPAEAEAAAAQVLALTEELHGVTLGVLFDAITVVRSHGAACGSPEVMWAADDLRTPAQWEQEHGVRLDAVLAHLERRTIASLGLARGALVELVALNLRWLLAIDRVVPVARVRVE